MPTFRPDDIDIDADEYLTSCYSSEIQEVIDWLVKNEWIEKPTKSHEARGYDEVEYQKALSTLSGKWNMLSPEESNFIVSLAKRLS